MTLPIGDVPAVRIAAQSTAFEPQSYASIAVVTQGADRVLTLQDDDGSPLAGAEVTLDYEWKRYTDGAGHVSFPTSIMPLGEHNMRIVTADGRVLQQTVLVR